VNAGITLKMHESILWEIVREKLRATSARSMTRWEFVRKSDATPACVIVRAHGKRYGFCTYLGLLGKRSYREWGRFRERKKLRREQIKALRRRLRNIIRALRSKMNEKRKETRLRMRRKTKSTRKLMARMRLKMRKKTSSNKAIRRQVRKLRLAQRDARQKMRKIAKQRYMLRKLRRKKAQNRTQKHARNLGIIRKLIAHHEEEIAMLHAQYAQEEKIQHLVKVFQDNRAANARYKKSLTKLGDDLSTFKNQLRTNTTSAIASLESEIFDTKMSRSRARHRHVTNRMATSNRWWGGSRYIYGGYRNRYHYHSRTISRGPPVVIYLDFFNKPCDNTIKSSICSQYVRMRTHMFNDNITNSIRPHSTVLRSRKRGR